MKENKPSQAQMLAYLSSYDPMVDMACNIALSHARPDFLSQENFERCLRTAVILVETADAPVTADMVAVAVLEHTDIVTNASCQENSRIFSPQFALILDILKDKDGRGKYNGMEAEDLKKVIDAIDAVRIITLARTVEIQESGARMFQSMEDMFQQAAPGMFPNGLKDIFNEMQKSGLEFRAVIDGKLETISAGSIAREFEDLVEDEQSDDVYDNLNLPKLRARSMAVLESLSRVMPEYMSPLILKKRSANLRLN